METLSVNDIRERLISMKLGLEILVNQMETLPIIGEINRPVVKVKKERKKRTPAPKVESPDPTVEVRSPRKRRTKKEMAEANSIPEIPPVKSSKMYEDET